LRALAVIETAQRAGLGLDKIRLLLRAAPADRAATDQLRDVAEKKLPVLREAIERAEIVRRWLEDAARCCCPTLPPLRGPRALAGAQQPRAPVARLDSYRSVASASSAST